jgi:THO complex subunit 4
LFTEVGQVKKVAVHYDRNGRSEGTGEVKFVKKSDALAAIKKLNGAKIDGRAISLTLLSNNSNNGATQQKKSITIRRGRGGIIVSTRKPAATTGFARKLKIR